MHEKAAVAAKTLEAKKQISIHQAQRTRISQSISSSVDHILFLQRTIGNQAVQKLIKSGALQAKLKIGQPMDKYEQEADQVAEQVVSSASLQRKCTACPEDEEKGLVQRSPISGTAGASVPDSFIHDLGAGQPLDSATRAFFEPRFGQDFSSVMVHTDDKAAASADAMAADAYVVGGHLVFGAGHYRPETEGGRRLIAHELMHTVQSGSGAVKGMIRRRRVPAGAGLGAALPTAGAGFISGRTGLARVLSRAWAGLTGAQQATVRTAASAFGITFVAEADLLTLLNSATRAQLVRFGQEIRAAAPTAELGDPLLINIGARPATADAANITTLVNNANAIFTTIAGGSRDGDVGQVFGTANVATAKTKYVNARTRMNALKTANKIVTDRSGYSAEVGLGGLSNSSQISVSPSTIDNPNHNESVITIIHESMHAGNSDVHDFGYITQPSFIALAEAVKLTNAAHYEVVPRRIRGASHAFAGQTFIPAGTTVGGVTAPALTTRQQSIRGASEMYRSAWTAGLNLHNLFVRLFRTPTEWSTLDLSTEFAGAAAGSRFSNTLPFWSKVEMLTIHTRAASINPAGVPAVRPVTLIDIALSEGLTRKMSQGMYGVPQTEADALAFENANATVAERTAAAASADAERDLLIRLVIRVKLGSITGAVSRDERVVRRLAQASRASNYTDYLQVRTPGAFP